MERMCLLMITTDDLKFVKAKNDYANARKSERNKVISYLDRQVDGSVKPFFNKGACFYHLIMSSTGGILSCQTQRAS